ncbi:MAG TPA: glycerophosphodiester phosphodiesterase [Candidatus Saccharimonadales bacterium]|nr:glycerophosphodiester phosphodiesterase [Candidatus Saccharimonadales bacterium]
MEIIGHRGARALLPQNTLPSFELALNNKVPMIEFDTELAKTGEVIIFHDDELDQITRGAAHGLVNSFTFNVHDGFTDGKFYQIPTLEEVLDLVDRHSKDGQRTKVNIELKGANTAEPVSTIVKRYLASGWRPADFIVSSFRHDELEKFKQIMPELDIAVLLDGQQWQELGGPQPAVDLGRRLGAVAINPDLKFASPELVKSAHDNGFEVNVYTVNAPEDVRRMAEIGVDRIFTDDPVTAKQTLAA